MQRHTLTPLNDSKLADLVKHINEDHLDDIKSMAIGLLELTQNQCKNLQSVMLKQIYQEGFVLDLQFGQDWYQPNKQEQKIWFLQFDTAIQSAEQFNEQYIALLQRSDRKQGKKTIEIRQRHFVLQAVSAVSQNMYRLTLQSKTNLSQLPAGYAFLLNLSSSATKQNSNRPYRYYTLRKAWQAISPQGEKQHLAWIDIYCHGKKNGEFSLGETWVKSVQINDIITSEREFPEKIEHLNGQSLLIADETSLPTVARLIELWQNPQMPIVLLFLQNAQELAYLDEALPSSCITVLPVIAKINDAPHEQIFAQLIDFLQHTPIKIDSIWGGLGAATTKHLRPMLRNFLGSNCDIVLKVYWRDE